MPLRKRLKATRRKTLGSFSRYVPMKGSPAIKQGGRWRFPHTWFPINPIAGFLQWLKGGLVDRADNYTDPVETNVQALTLDGTVYGTFSNPMNIGSKDFEITVIASTTTGASSFRTIFGEWLNANGDISFRDQSGAYSFVLKADDASILIADFPAFDLTDTPHKFTIKRTGNTLETIYDDAPYDTDDITGRSYSASLEANIGRSSSGTTLGHSGTTVHSIEVTIDGVYEIIAPLEEGGNTLYNAVNGDTAVLSAGVWERRTDKTSYNLSDGCLPSATGDGVGAYIDTGVALSAQGMVEIDGVFSAVTEYHGAFTDNRFFLGSAGATYQFGFDGASGDKTGTAVPDGKRHVLTVKNYNLYVDGVLDIRNDNDETVSKDWLSSGNFFIHARQVSGAPSDYGTGKLYRVRLWDDGVLLRDMVPYGTDSWYDRVANQIFTNDGTGTIAVEYIPALANQDYLINYDFKMQGATVYWDWYRTIFGPLYDIETDPIAYQATQESNGIRLIVDRPASPTAKGDNYMAHNVLNKQNKLFKGGNTYAYRFTVEELDTTVRLYIGAIQEIISVSAIGTYTGTFVCTGRVFDESVTIIEGGPNMNVLISEVMVWDISGSPVTNAPQLSQDATGSGGLTAQPNHPHNNADVKLIQTDSQLDTDDFWSDGAGTLEAKSFQEIALNNDDDDKVRSRVKAGHITDILYYDPPLTGASLIRLNRYLES